MSVISKEMETLLETGSVLRIMFEEGKKMMKQFGAENVFDFSLGNPSVPAPAAFDEALKEVVEENDSFALHAYMSNAGYEETRRAIADDLNRRFGMDYQWDNITMTVGAANALVIAMKILTDPGDEVIVFAPFFLEYRNYIANFGAVTKIVPPNPPTFLPDIEALRQMISPRTKAVLINSPNNPTGVIYDEASIRAIADVLEEAQEKVGHPIFLISDEPYRELVYGGEEVPYPAKYYRNTMTAYSYSKAMSIPGERIGYLAIPKEADESERLNAAAAIGVRVCGCVNAPSLQQKAIVKVLNERCDVSIYDENRRLFLSILDEAGFEYVEPRGAFYIYMKTPIEDDREFSAAAKDRYHLLLAAGSAFYGPGYVRLAYCVPKDRIERSRPQFLALGHEYGLN